MTTTLNIPVHSTTITRKFEVIDRIIHLENENVLDEIEKLLRQIEIETKQKNLLTSLSKPIKKEFDLEALKKEKNYRSFDRATFNQLIIDMDIQEPIEELLALLSK